MWQWVQGELRKLNSAWSVIRLVAVVVLLVIGLDLAVEGRRGWPIYILAAVVVGLGRRWYKRKIF